MKKSKKFSAMPVISLEEGQQIGAVKELVVDPAGKRIAALVIEQKGWFKEQRIIPFHKIHSVGEDAITIEKSSGVERAGSLPDIFKLLKDKVGVTGAKIVSEKGTVLGFVDEYYVDLSTGTIAGLEFSGNFINSMVKGRAFLDIAYVRTLGKEVVVINDEGLENVYKLDGGLHETVKSIRDSTGHFWENTVQKTKELSSTINKSLEKVRKDKKADPEGNQPDETGLQDLTPQSPESVEKLPAEQGGPENDEQEKPGPPAGSSDSRNAPPPA